MQMPFEFVFLRPWWLLLIPLGLVLAYLVTRQDRDSWRRVCDRELLLHMIQTTARASQRLVWGSILVGWLLAVIAIAGPAWDRDQTSTYHSVDAMVVVFDLSRSMSSIDLQPSRLERARYKALEIVEAQQDKSVGLVAFAGDAFSVTPISDDIETVIHLLQSLQIRMMPIQGSMASQGLRQAHRLLTKSGYPSGTVVLVTDGIDDQAFAAAESLRQHNYRLSVIAAGTPAGSPIRLDNGDFLKDAAGNFIVSPVDHEHLAELASVGGGQFSQVTEPISESMLQAIIFGADSIESTSDNVASVSWNDRGPWFLVLLLPLVAIIFRRGWILSVIVLLPLSPQQSYAMEWEDLWQRSDQQAKAALERGDLTDTRLADHPDWHGIALYRQDYYNQAAAAFGHLNGKIAKFNHGNALAKAGELEAAIERYESALEIDPNFEDAKFNLEVVKKALQQEQQRQQGRQNETRENQDSQSANAEESADQPERIPPSDDRSDSEQQADQDDSRELAEQSAQAQDSTDEEQNQLMEQWLREIPDDPAGLLRRRFHFEYQQRDQPLRAVNAW